jgi:gas vesicle protein
VTGGALAILFAPEKGTVTRERIKTRATDMYGKGKGWVDETQQTVREKVGGISERTRGTVQDLSGAAKQQVESVKAAVAEGKEAYRREMEKS